MFVCVFVRDNLENGWMDFDDSFFVGTLRTPINTWATFFAGKRNTRSNKVKKNRSKWHFFMCSLWILSNTWTTLFRKKWTDGRSVPLKLLFSYIKVYIYYKIQIVIYLKIAHWTWQAYASHCFRQEHCYCHRTKDCLWRSVKLMFEIWAV